MRRRTQYLAVATVLAAAALLVLALLLPRAPAYKSAKITLQFPDSNNAVTVDDASELRRLIGYMPGVGTRSWGPLYSQWTTVRIDLTTTEGQVVTVRTDLSSDTWSEHGKFYRAKPGFGRYLDSLLRTRRSGTTKGTP